MTLRSFSLQVVLPVLCVAVLSPRAWGGEKPRVEVKKVAGSTAAIAKLDGELDVPAAAVQAVLCDLEGHPRFSESSERVAVVTDMEARAFEAAKPKKRSTVEPQVQPGRHRPACPGRTYVLNLLDFPFPMRDGWSMAVYDAAVSGTTFQMKFDTVIGSDKGAGVYTVTPISATRSHLVMVYNIDLGVPLPGFLFDWVMNSQMPGMFEAIGREAKKHVRE